MQVHICTFQIKLTTVRVSSSLNIARYSLQSVWRGEQGQIIVVGAVRSIIKNGRANFNEIFEIKTDMIRDANNDSYLPSSFILQIRPTSQAFNQKISSSICRLSLNNLLNRQEMSVVELQTDDKVFINRLEVKCLQVVNTGLKKSQKKLQRKLNRQKQSQNGVVEHGNRIERSSSSHSRDAKNRSQFKQNCQVDKEQYQNLQLQISKLKQQLQSEQANHIMTSQQLRNAQLQIAEQEQVINQISAMISQRETNIIQLNQRIEKLQNQVNQLNNLNKFLQKIAKESSSVETKNTQLKKQNAEREKQIHQLKIKLLQTVEKEKEAKIQSSKEKQINIFLTKSIDQLKKDLNRKQQQISCLTCIKKLNETEKEKFQEELKSLKENYIKNQEQYKSDLAQSSTKFNQLYEKYSKLKQSSVQVTDMVSRLQLQEMEKNYEIKLKQFQERELLLKENVQVIEKQMMQLQELLQDKEENQVKLIEYSRKLQLEVDRLEAQKQFWNRVRQDIQQQSKDSQEDEQKIQLRSKIKKLLLILKEKSNCFLQSEKNKVQLALIQKENKQIHQRLSLFKDEAKQVKDKYTLLLKENKKLIEKLHKLQKDNENLVKNNHKLNNEFNTAAQKERTANQQYQILNYRMVWLQKQLAHLKAIQNEQRSLSQAYNYFDRNEESGMGVIKQASEEFISSQPQSRKDFEHNKDETKQFNTEVLFELTSLLKQRVHLSEKFCTKIQEKGQNENVKQYYELQKQFNELSRLTTQLKRKLLLKGERETAVNFELQLKKVSEQLNKLQMPHR